ncbi:Werner Syndrome-like exonuclease isoform X1 [Schistocerca americana]|uniref:Werner Syndrome-like exonuclease isoform X1 n=1 Tax=Schistocerca americana TaxID=7009 RepID=UPI001F4F587E|nr:Werner Syndrome-like exonuclease isoform X1 [Schistocerca americana]
MSNEQNRVRIVPVWLSKKGNDEIQESEFLRFKGEINYCATIGDCGMACESLMEMLTNLDEMVVGFDMEWPVNSKTGSGKTSLIQICHDENVCHLFHVSQMRNIPVALAHFLNHPKVRLAGLNIKSDLWKLIRDFPIKFQSMDEMKIIDLGVLANKVLNCSQRWSLERLVRYVLHKNLDKNDAVRKSNWQLELLSEEQKHYAAADALASFVLFHELTSKKKVKCEI